MTACPRAVLPVWRATPEAVLALESGVLPVEVPSNKGNSGTQRGSALTKQTAPS